MAKKLSDRERFPELFKTHHVDRRGSTRKVPMKVLVLGYGRTGTLSIQTALLQLGYHDVYHMFRVVENPPDVHLWREAVDAKFRGIGKPYGRAEWDALLGHCEAVTDFPCAAFAPELIAAYPEAKVILTTRPVDAWYSSTEKTIDAGINSYGTYFCSLYDRTFTAPWIAMVHRMWAGLFRGSFKKNGKEVYLDHFAEIQQLVPKDRLLNYEVGKDGWAPLCDFLGVPVPKEDFPRVNETKAFGDRILAYYKKLAVMALKVVVPSVLVLGVVGVGLVGVRRGWFLTTYTLGS